MRDKLSRDERIRLECLSQAVTQSMKGPSHYTAEYIVKNAAILEKYIKNGKTDDGNK